MLNYRNIKDGQTVTLNGRPVAVVIGYQPNVTLANGEPAIFIREFPESFGRYVSVCDVRRVRRVA